MSAFGQENNFIWRITAIFRGVFLNSFPWWRIRELPGALTPLPYLSPYLYLPSLPEYNGIKEKVNPILAANSNLKWDRIVKVCLLVCLLQDSL